MERFEIEQPGLQTHVLTDHVLTLFLKPTMMQHAQKNGRISDLPLDAGQVVICVRDDIERVGWNTLLSVLCVRIGHASLREAARSLLSRDDLALQAKPGANDPRLTSLLSALEAERVCQYPSGKLFLDSVESAVASLLVTSHSTTRVGPVVNMGGMAPRRLRRVLEFMRDNLARQVGLAELASQAELSSSHFSHQFRASMGVSPYKYMLALRLDHAKALLKNHDLSILEIGLAVGFENQQHFATVFRRAVGVTPSMYRRQF